MSSAATTPTPPVADPTITPPVGPTTIGPDTQDPNKDPNSLEYRSAANVVSRLSGRLWDAIKEGIPAFNSKFEAAAHTDTGTLANGETPKEQLITPEAAMTPKERKAHPILTGVGESLGSFTSPENAIIMAGTGGFGELPGAAGKLIPKLLSLKFSADAIKGAYAQIPDFKAAMDRGDESEAERIIAHIVTDTAVGADVGQHAVKGAFGEGIGKLDTGRTITKGAEKAPVEISNQVESATAPALAKPAPTDFSSVGGVKVERRAADSPFRTPGTTMKKVADQSYAAMREHGIDTTPAPVETKLEEPSGKFAPVGGVEQRAATTFGRTGGSFGRTVDQTYDVLRAQADAEKTPVEISNTLESKLTPEVLQRDSDPEKLQSFRNEYQKQYNKLLTKFRASDDPVEQRDTLKLIYRMQNMMGHLEFNDQLDNTPEFRTRKDDDFLKSLIQEKMPKKPALASGEGSIIDIPNKVESNVAAPAIHPDLQKLSDKYGVSDDPEKVRNGASFIRPDGQFVHLTPGTEHPEAIARATGKPSTGSYDNRANFLADTGAIRTRFHMGRNGQTLSVSVPEKGVTPEQIQALKDGFRTSMDGGRGNLVMEIGTPNGKSTQADYVTASEIEPALARIGALPGQRVNLSDAYGDTGTYIGGHVPLQAGKDFPGNFEKDNFTSRRTTGNNMFDPEGFITGEEMAKGMTPANSHREFPSEEDYQNTVHSRGVNVEDVVKKYPRVFNDPAMANMAESRIDKVNWDAQAKGAPKGVTNRQVWNENIGVTHGPDLLEVPKNRIGPNQTTPTVLHHEIGHIIAAHQEGLPTDESFIGSHLSTHSQDTGGAAYTNFDFSRLPGAKKVGGGVTFSPDDLAKAFPTLIHIMLGGGAMEDILDGVPWQKNEGLAGDLRQIRGIGKALGLSPDEVEAKISKQMDITKSRLNKPEILDIVKNASATREEGLSKTLHMSKERVQRDIIQKLNEVTSGKRTDDTSTSTGDTAGTVRGADQGIGEAASSREGQVSGGDARGDESTAVQGSLFSSKAIAAKEEEPDPYDKIVDLHTKNGGATWNLAQNKNLSGTDNYAVSIHPDRTLPVKGELTPEIVKSFAEKNADLLKDPTESLGTWNDKANNQHVLDVVKTIPDRAEAVRLGFENKQDAIYHLKGEGKEIFMKDEQEKPPAASLPEDYQSKVAAIRQTHGDDAAFNEVAQYLKPEEREKVTNVLKRNVLDQFAKLPAMEDFEEAAKAGEIQKGWYKNTATVLKDVFGQDTRLFTNITAALSPLKAVRENFRDALEFYADWVEAGRPTEGRKLDNITTKKFMGTYAQNLQRAVKGEDVSGPKVGNFAENLKGNLEEVTKDRWMAFFSGDAKAQWTKSKRQAFDVAMRRTAEKLGWDPAEVQETIWSFVKSVVESSEKEGVTPSEKAKSLTDTEVREGAGSFANLIKDPKIAASFERVAEATGDNRFRPESVQSSKGYRKAQRSTPAPKGQPVRGSADVLGRVAERTNKAARFNTLQKGIAKLGEERQPGDEDE